MVISEFFLNQIFFKELQNPSQHVHIQTLKEIHNEINKFEHPIIIYNPSSDEYIQFLAYFNKNKQNIDRNLRIVLERQMYKLISSQTTNGNLVDHCLLEENSCLLSISHNKVWHERIYRDSSLEMETNNIFDVNSFNEYYESEKIQDYIVDIIKVGGETNKIGHLDDLYTNLKSVEISSRFNADYCCIADPGIKQKINKIFYKLFLGKKQLEDYKYHDESPSVKQNRKKKEQRKVTFNGKIKYIYMHLKITRDWSVYAEVADNTLFLGQITNHLSTKKFP